MKITLDIPDTTVAAFLNYLWLDEDSRYAIASHALDTSSLHDGAEIKVRTEDEEER